MDSLNTGVSTPENTPAPEGHDAAMIAKVDEVEKGLQPEPAKQPEKILGKFDSVDDLTKAYEELERKLGGGAKDEPASELNDEDQKKVEEVVETAGLDFGALETKYAETGALDDADYEALEKAGVPRSMVDNYIAGQEAQGLVLRNQVFDSVGGEENFNAIAQWAGANLTPAELQSYNDAVDSNDLTRVKSAVELVSLKYTQAMGSTPNLISGDTSSVSSANVFQSVAQLTAAMRDPRYETDPAYRKEVETRLKHSNIL